MDSNSLILYLDQLASYRAKAIGDFDEGDSIVLVNLPSLNKPAIQELSPQAEAEAFGVVGTIVSLEVDEVELKLTYLNEWAEEVTIGLSTYGFTKHFPPKLDTENFIVVTKNVNPTNAVIVLSLTEAYSNKLEAYNHYIRTHNLSLGVNNSFYDPTEEGFFLSDEDEFASNRTPVDEQTPLNDSGALMFKIEIPDEASIPNAAFQDEFYLPQDSSLAILLANHIKAEKLERCTSVFNIGEEHYGRRVRYNEESEEKEGVLESSRSSGDDVWVTIDGREFWCDYYETIVLLPKTDN